MLVEPRRVRRHNFPLSVFPHPDICPSPCFSERFAVFVLACDIIIPIRDRKVLAVHAYIEGGIGRAGDRVGIIFPKSEVGFSVQHCAVCAGVGKVVRPDTFKEGRIFGERGLAPRIGELRKLFRDLFDFVN